MKRYVKLIALILAAVMMTAAFASFTAAFTAYMNTPEVRLLRIRLNNRRFYDIL